jgi:hypothetical protein
MVSLTMPSEPAREEDVKLIIAKARDEKPGGHPAFLQK